VDRKTVYPKVNKKLYEDFKLLAKKSDISINVLFEEAMKLIIAEKEKE